MEHDSLLEGSRHAVEDEEEALQPVIDRGRFRNPWLGFRLPTILMMIGFWWHEKHKSRVPKKEILDETLPIVKPNLEELKKPMDSGIRVTWIGHASVLVQMDKINILTDPVFSKRCGPMRWLGSKRYRDTPCEVNDLPKIDAVVISHSHYDHLDYWSVQDLNSRFGDSLRWFVPFGMKQWMESMNCTNVVEQKWWEEAILPATDERPEATFVFTPAQHWSGRTLWDQYASLWGSWTIVGPWHKFFFAGDSGYFKGFNQVGKKYGPFDLAAVPIGAYCPRYIMRNQHVDPAEAVEVHCDVKAKKSLGIHWGTFDLSSEFYLDPPSRVDEAMRAKGLSTEDFFTLRHGETRVIGDDFDSID